VMSARPGRILADIKIALPRPRSVRALQKDPQFHAIYAEVWGWLEQALGNFQGDKEDRLSAKASAVLTQSLTQKAEE